MRGILRYGVLGGVIGSGAGFGAAPGLEPLYFIVGGAAVGLGAVAAAIAQHDEDEFGPEAIIAHGFGMLVGGTIGVLMWLLFG